MGYQVGTSTALTALHRMPGMPPPEGELHPHDYRIEVVVGREELDERAMVCDLDVLEGALRALGEGLAGADLETIRPPEREAVTVEVLARWIHDRLAQALRGTGAETLEVRVWESAVAFGGYRSGIA
jgi:6-pyruvoyltetrahydropterin/6-carboxytetrahydropterin synthase